MSGETDRWCLNAEVLNAVLSVRCTHNKASLCCCFLVLYWCLWLLTCTLFQLPFCSSARLGASTSIFFFCFVGMLFKCFVYGYTVCSVFYAFMHVHVRVLKNVMSVIFFPQLCCLIVKSALLSQLEVCASKIKSTAECMAAHNGLKIFWLYHNWFVKTWLMRRVDNVWRCAI